jgi:alpha-1,6-mannosyltransferase
MGRDDPWDAYSQFGPSRLFCDLTQSWSAVGGGVGTYLRHKRQHILQTMPHRHLLIVPGPRDSVVEEGRAITVTIASPRVPGSPNYRLMLRNGAVRDVLERFQPDLIECQDAYNLPWVAISHAKRHPGTALVAAYMTDFPTVYVERPFRKVVGRTLAGAAARLCYWYCGQLYRRFDGMFALSENGGMTKLKALGIDRIEVVPLGVELGEFSPGRRDPGLRRSLGVGDGQPLLVYAGRIDREKRAQLLVDAWRRLPPELGAHLLLIGDGPLRDQIRESGEPRLHAPGYVRDRSELACWLASADIYVSGMADETFGVSIVEAQASGLPVVGVAAGAMVDRVTPAIGRLGPVDDAEAMAGNIIDLWNADRAKIAQLAQEQARQYSWDRSMADLFTSLYPKAFRQASLRGLQQRPMGMPALADAWAFKGGSTRRPIG